MPYLRFFGRFFKLRHSQAFFILQLSDSCEKIYNVQAIFAAIHILNERKETSLKTESIVNKMIFDQEKRKIERKNWLKEYYKGILLWYGIACIGCAFYLFAPTLFTSEKSLIETDGKIQNVRTFYTQVSSKGHKSVKSELILKLENDERIYKLTKNIEQSWYNEKYELIEKKLKKSGKAIVWIKKSQQSDIDPVVFQIATGENEFLFDIDDAKSELRIIFPFLLIMGFFGIGVYINYKYSNRIKTLIVRKPTRKL
jgi:hypothetical protein